MPGPETQSRLVSRSVIYVVTAVVVIYTLFPVLWMLNTSFKTRIDMISTPVVWIVERPTIESYFQAFVERPFLRYMLNSLIVAATVTAISMVFGTLAGYALSRFRFPGTVKKHLSFWIISTRMMPPIVTIIPLYMMFSWVGLLNSKIALIIAYTGFNLPFVVWLMRSYFADLPRDLSESALVDGDTHWGAFLRITLPLAKPGFVASAVFCFILSWNELLFALIFTDTAAANTLPIGIAGRITQFEVAWGEISAAGFVACIPIIILAFVVQKHIVRGLTFGAVKS
jgi:multiple sugar transport system permease protein